MIQKRLFILIVSAVTCVSALFIFAADEKSSNALLKEAQALGSQGKYQEAIEKTKQAIEEKKVANNKRAHQYLGLMYFKTEQYDNSLSEFDQVIKTDEDSPMAYYFMALIYEAKALKEPAGPAASELKSNALLSWEKYLKYSEQRKTLSAAHENLGISLDKSVKQARKHIKMLKEGNCCEKN
jgi:tetratricopeptide (TPR) repeat protein